MPVSSKIRTLWSRHPRLRWPVVLALCFVAYSLIGFLLLPPIIKGQLVKQLPKVTKRTAQVREVRVNPWTLSLTVRGLALNEPDGSAFASWEEFYVNFQLSSIFRRAWTFEEIHLIDPRGAIVRHQNGVLNLANMLESSNAPAKPPSTNPPPRLLVYSLFITNGFLSIEDKSRRSPFHTEYRPINIALKNFSTRSGTDTPYSFRAENDTGKTLDWAGSITLEPFSSRGHIDLKRGEPKKYNPYLDDFTTADITDGRIDIRADYFVGVGTNGVDLIVTNGFVELKNFKLTESAANETVLSIADATVQGLDLNLRERRTEAKLFKITGTELSTRLNKDGSFNLVNLIIPGPTNKPASTATNSSQPWLVNLGEFVFENGSVTFEDQTWKSPFQSRLSPIEISVTGFSTNPKTNAQYKFAITSEAGEKVGGAGTLAIGPFVSGGELSMTAAEVKKYKPYFEKFLRAEVLSGKIESRTSYQTAPGTTAISNALVKLTDLKLKLPENDEIVVSIPEFALEEGELNLEKRSARVGRVKSDRGSIIVRLETNGVLNLASFAQRTEPSTNITESTPAPENEKPAPWSAGIDEVAFENLAVNFEDKRLATPRAVKVDQIALNLKGLSTSLEKPFTTAVGMRINETGSLTGGGTVTLSPILADLDLAITNLDLRALQPYIEPHARLQLTSGLFNLASHAKWESKGTNSGHLEFTGGFSIPAFVAIAESTNLVAWTNLAVDGIKLELEPNKLHIDTVRWEALDANLLVNSNKQLNVTAVLAQKTQGAPTEGEKSSAFPISVNTFALTNSDIRLLDESVQPPLSTELNQLGGTITGLSSDASATAEVNLAGSFGEHAPFSVTGRINPLAKERRLDLTITNHNMQLTPFTSYMEKYAGHPLNRGRLSMALHYKIEGKELNAENRVQIDQFTLGPRVDSPDATKLPVKLAVALLKDVDGRIQLDIPVSGRLDDPQFRVGPIILKVIVNLITKAVASPFKLLGAAVGGGEELSFLEFQPGSARFAAGETNKIDKLIKALVSKPALTLELEAAVDPRRDRDTLARQIVQQQIRAARLKELSSVGEAANAENLEVEPLDQQRLLRAAIMQQFGTNVTQAVEELKSSMTNQVASSEVIEGRKQKWYQPILIPFQGKDSPAAAARRQAKADAELLKQNPELGSLSAELMEKLLATKTEVPPEQFVELMKRRTEAARDELLKSSELNADRLSIVPAKAIKEGYHGEARVNLSLN